MTSPDAGRAASRARLVTASTTWPISPPRWMSGTKSPAPTWYRRAPRVDHRLGRDVVDHDDAASTLRALPRRVALRRSGSNGSIVPSGPMVYPVSAASGPLKKNTRSIPHGHLRRLVDRAGSSLRSRARAIASAVVRATSSS